MYQSKICHKSTDKPLELTILTEKSPSYLSSNLVLIPNIFPINTIEFFVKLTLPAKAVFPALVRRHACED